VAGPLITSPLIECVPNFSEGRDATTVNAIERAIASAPGAFVLRSEMDPDHNRAVITFAGSPEAVAEGAFRGIAEAVERIDLRLHKGVHPRIGAADVVPFVPLRGAGMEQCAGIARRVGQAVWERLGVPVYFYEAAARSPERAPLENVRRGGFESPALPPDWGGPDLHPSAGASILGARPLLIAFNVNLNTEDLGVARAIARRIRASSGGLAAVKAMGVALPSRGCVQVSMNLTDFERTPIDRVLNTVRELADRHGVAVAGTQTVGLVPRKAIEDAASREPEWKTFDGHLILEDRIASAGL
jgi:glutamate formiminotransferase